MHDHFEFYHFLEDIAALLTIFTLLAPFAWRWISRINIIHIFVSDISSNHLPHLYSAQKAIAKTLHIELPDDPPIRFVEINGKH